MSTNTQLATMLQGYVDAMLWANVLCEVDGDSIETKDCRGDTLPAAIVDAMRAELADFDAYAYEVAPAEWEAYRREYDAERFGIDFALSRNGHGAGFFDRGLGFPALQKSAKSYGSSTLMRSADGDYSLS